MYWISFTLLVILSGVQIIDWSRLRQQLPALLFGILFPYLFSALPVVHEGFQYLDPGPLGSHWAVLVLQQVTLTPLLSLWFVHPVQPNAPVPLGRLLLFCGIAQAVLHLHSSAGKITLPPYYHPVIGLLFNVIWFTLTWKVQTYYLRVNASDRSVHMR